MSAFLLTRPLRDVTGKYTHQVRSHTFLLTRPLRDVTSSFFACTAFKLFLLTRPLRDVTVLQLHTTNTLDISTHTPLTGRDFPTVKTG